MWEVHHVRDLFDSIYKGFPIGVLILWQPTGRYLESLKPDADYIHFHDDIKKRGSMPESLVLDGHQRLTSIILPLYEWEIKRLGRIVADFKDEKVYFDASKEEFLVGRNIGRDLAEIYRAFYLYDTDTLEKLSKEVSKDTMDKLSRLARKIFEYRVPVYTYITEAEDVNIYVNLAEGFVRINKSGVKIGNVDLMSSLILGYQPDLSYTISNAFNKIRDSTGIDNKGLIIRLILRNIKIKQTDIARIPLKALKGLEKKIENAIKQGKQNELKKFIEEDVVNAFNDLQEIFKKESIVDGVKLKAGDIVPSQISLIPIAYYVINLKSRNEQLRNNDEIAIISWIILSSIRRWYVSRVDTKLQKDLEEIDEIVQKNKSFEDFVRTKLDKLSKISLDEIREVDIRRRNDPWVFVLHVLLSQRGADDWTGTKLCAQSIDKISLHHIFPRKLDIEKINSLANITLVNAEINKILGTTLPEQYLNNYRNTFKAHLIPEDESLWKVDNFEKFIEERTKMIYHALKNKFPLIFG